MDDYEPDAPRVLSGRPKPEDAEREERRLDRIDEQSFRRNQRWTNRALVFAAIVASIIGIWQGYLTRRAIEVANRQAKAAEDANAVARQSASQAAADSTESGKLSERALRETIRQNQLAERAWVGVQSADVLFEEGKDILGVLLIKNTGKTTAVNVWVRSGVFLVVKGHQLEEYLRLKEWTSTKVIKGVLFPQQEMKAKPILKEPIQGGFEPLINSGILNVYVYGNCEYEDVFGKRHRDEFCYLFYPDTKVLMLCEGHNSGG